MSRTRGEPATNDSAPRGHAEEMSANPPAPSGALPPATRHSLSGAELAEDVVRRGFTPGAVGAARS